MAVENVPLIAFNRGLISELGLARVDIKRTALSAAVFSNFMPRVLGSMMLRPGLGFLGDTRADARAHYLDFVFNLNDKALIELTEQHMRVWVDDAVITRVAVATQTVNGTFPANINNWTDLDERDAVSSWVAPNDMQLLGDSFNAAIREQQVVVAGADLNKEHALRVVIDRGPVQFQVGSASGADDYINVTTLDTGTHSLAFTPAGNFWVRFKSALDRPVLISNCTVEAAGAMDLPTPWLEADLDTIRYDASGDITYVAAGVTSQQRAIERRAARSWSIVLYAPTDGPFLVENVTAITITPLSISGAITLTANKPIFRSSHVGALFRISSIGQSVVAVAAGVEVFTDPLKVVGTGTDRDIKITIANITATGTNVQLERSDNPDTGWGKVNNYVVDQAAVNFNDVLDNQIWYYRLRVTIYAGAATTQLNLASEFGSITGVARVTAFTSSTVVNAEVIKHLGHSHASPIWSEGAWSPFRGFPSSVGFHNARLCWAGKSFFWGSVSDGFYSFDDTVEGDSGPISRSIGSGPIDNINWLLGLQRLLMGADMAEQQVVTSSLDEPITPTNFSIRPASTQGSHTVAGVKLDTRGIFAARGGTRVFDLGIDPAIGDYTSRELTAIVPDLFEDDEDISVDRSIVRIAVQRKPDTRVHFVRSDGTVAVLIFDRVENVECWVDVETDGEIEDVVILPGSVEDQVYYEVKRTINGATKRFLERWATEREARGATLTKLADAFIVYTGGAAVVPVAHLPGETIAVWADGIDIGHDDDDNLIYTVDGTGHLTLPQGYGTVIVGLPYNADWQAAKLAYAAQLGTALTQKKKVGGLAMILKDTHARGVKYGPDFDSLDSLPQIEDGEIVDPDSIWARYDKASFEFAGDWSSDPLLCIRAMSPRPCTILALVPTVETNEKQ